VGRLKITIEIENQLLTRVKALARRRKTSVRALTEEGLRLVLRQKGFSRWKWNPVVVRGNGLTDEFKKAGWDRIRDELYRVPTF
jgi:hypothetical protein